MKKNNKGFTLIEVIAVIVILGIMAVIAVPKIYELISGSRNEIYVQDARRFISKAQYKMSSGSDKIEKPDLDECIVVSLNYLNDKDFKNAPNNGEYLANASFVVIKNVNGEYYYSVMMVEKKNDNSYVGVELSSENELTKKNAKSHVRAINEDEIVYISENNASNSSGDVIDMGEYINNKIKVTDSEKSLWSTENEDIIGYYYNDNAGGTVDLANNTVPRISAKFGSNGGSLQTTLSVTATDSDDSLSDLTLCLKVSRNNNDNYPNPSVDEERALYCFSYGSDLVHVIDVNLASDKYGKFTHSDRDAYFYITVTDPQGNIAHKKLLYNIHINAAPVISKFNIVKQDDDKFNFPKAKMLIEASDDIDTLETLKVCLVQDNEYTFPGSETAALTAKCKSYSPFYEIFNSDNNGYYTFKEQSGSDWKNISIPDGTTHNLRVVLMDSYGLETEANATYSIYNNQSPEVTTDGKAQGIPITIDGVSVGNSLTAKINMTVKDDISKSNNITVIMGEKEMTYSDYLNSDKLYTFSGTLDGKNRKLTVKVVDEFGATTEKEFVLENVYKSTKPTVSIKSIGSLDSPCDGASSCFDKDNGGSLQATYTLELSDDVTPVLDLLICVSENADDCKKTETHNFIKNSKQKKSYTFSNYSSTYDYPPNETEPKKLYAAVIDGDGLYSITETPVEYKLYHNFPPVITGDFDISVEEKMSGYEKLLFDFDSMIVEDDFSNYTASFCYKYSPDNKEICNDYSSYSTMKNELASGFRYEITKGTITIYFKFLDNYGESVKSKSKVHQAEGDQIPIITSLSLESTAERYNSNTFDIKFKVLDQDDQYRVCVTENSNSCSNYLTLEDGSLFSGSLNGDTPLEYSLRIDGEKSFSWDENYDEESTRKTIYLYVMDEHGNVVSGSTDYALYKICSNKNNMLLSFTSNTFTPVSGETPISALKCLGACYHQYSTTTNESHINYMNGVNNVFGLYNHEVHYTDVLIQKECTKNEETYLYCDDVDCFLNDDDDKVTTYIDLNVVNENDVWSYSTTMLSEVVADASEQCTNDEGQLFNRNDYRCNDDMYCNNKVEEVCTDKCEKDSTKSYIEYLAERDAAANAYAELKRKEYESYLDYCECVSCEKILACDDGSGGGSGDVSFRRIFEGEKGNLGIGDLIIDDCKLIISNTTLLNKCRQRKAAGKVCSDCDTSYRLPEKFECSDWVNADIDALVEQDRQEFINDYPPYTTRCDPDDPESEYYIACFKSEMSSCQSYLSTFCNNSPEEFKYVVSCDDGDYTDGPYNCLQSGYSDGYCLGDVDSCAGGLSSKKCRQVCYKDAQCSYQKPETKTFLCHGYFKSYRSVIENGDLVLKETGLRVCPDFYRLYPDLFKYDTSSLSPFIQFNSNEQRGE